MCDRRIRIRRPVHAYSNNGTRARVLIMYMHMVANLTVMYFQLECGDRVAHIYNYYLQLILLQYYVDIERHVNIIRNRDAHACAGRGAPTLMTTCNSMHDVSLESIAMRTHTDVALSCK